MATIMATIEIIAKEDDRKDRFNIYVRDIDEKEPTDTYVGMVRATYWEWSTTSRAWMMTDGYTFVWPHKIYVRRGNNYVLLKKGHTTGLVGAVD